MSDYALELSDAEVFRYTMFFGIVASNAALVGLVFAAVKLA